jgi:hypothetical protein
VSARPKAYKQNAETMEVFKKTSPSAWRKSAINKIFDCVVEGATFSNGFVDCARV